MHHKRGKARYARGYRAGRGMVKPWKMNGAKHKRGLRARASLRADEAANLQIQQGD